MIKGKIGINKYTKIMLNERTKRDGKTQTKRQKDNKKLWTVFQPKKCKELTARRCFQHSKVTGTKKTFVPKIIWLFSISESFQEKR